MRSYILLSLLIAVSLTANAMAAMQNQTSAIHPMGDIMLNGTNFIKAPEISFSMPGFNWTYPYSYYPIYSEGQSISGAFTGTDQQADINVRLSISDFNLSKFFSASAVDITGVGRDMPLIKLNSTGAGNFTLQGQQNGTYTLSAIDELNSTVLSMLPLVVTAQEISVNSSKKVLAGGALKVTVNSPGSDNLTKYYGAIMVSSKDYEGIKLDIASNGNQENLSSTIAFGNRSMTIQGLPSISSELLLNLFAILPQDSAVGMQPTTKHEAEFYLMTDSGWEHGSYILTCVVYSPEKGILGMRQIPVEVD